jgi:general secretion pathway protein L
VSVLRIRVSVAQVSSRVQWALVGDRGERKTGEARLAQLPRRAGRVQVVLPASEVLITRVRLPEGAKRRSGPLLAYAVEEDTLREPEASQVSWLGSAEGDDVLAVADRAGLWRWREALQAAGITGYEVHCEQLLLPLVPGEWSVAWDGSEGFVRTGPLEGAATDSGDSSSPPLSLRLLLDQARKTGKAPGAIAIYTTAPKTMPDVDAWQRALEVPVRDAGEWDWTRAPADAGVALAQERRAWRIAPGLLPRLRPAAWIAGAALALHAVALTVAWGALAGEQRTLQKSMVARFRAVFPDAVAVVDPALQMRRKLAEARHVAGQPDPGDFLPMLGQVAAGLEGVIPPGALKVVSYESGRMTLQFAAGDEAAVRRAMARLTQSGFTTDMASRAGGAGFVVTVRAP